MVANLGVTTQTLAEKIQTAGQRQAAAQNAARKVAEDLAAARQVPPA